MRSKIKNLLSQKYDLQQQIDMEIERYINNTEGNLLYISDHALIRYMERQEQFVFTSKDDRDKIKELPISPEQIREQMLTREDQERIVRMRGDKYTKNGLSFICRYLTIITVLKE